MIAQDLVKRHEGCSLTAIRDTRGWSIGWGHDGAIEGGTCTQDEADAAFDLDFAHAMQEAMGALGVRSWVMLDAPRQAALTDMAYELGGHGLAMFRNTLALLRLEDYDAAAAEMLRSRWASEVPHRAKEDAEIIRTGEWPVV